MKMYDGLNKMLTGDYLLHKMSIYPEYNYLYIKKFDPCIRLNELSKIYDIYVPTKMTIEIYVQLYLSLIKSLNKKCTMAAQKQRYCSLQNGVIGGADSFTILGDSGIGKSTAINVAIKQIINSQIIEIQHPYSKVIPFLTVQCPYDSSVRSMLLEIWRYGALARLDKSETIDKLLHNGYSTLSLGYAGLYECVKYMTGNSHTDGDKGEKFGLEVMQALNDKCNRWKNEENIDYSLYGSPIESTTYKFAKCLKKRFGIVKGITDRDYITNSYHVPVFEKIDPFTKLSIESKFQKLSPGGAISYIECADLTHNINAVLEVMQFIYNNIMYAELNTKSDYCQVCGYDGEIKIIDENNELIWECPNCGNRDKNKMNVARRTCGYIGSNFWNKGRTEEIAERYVHLDDHENEVN